MRTYALSTTSSPTSTTASPLDPAPPQPQAQLRETHTGLVLLYGDRAYKIKKPVVTDFLDFGDPAARDQALARERELNSRISPDVYLGVVHLPDPTGGPSEPVLVMRRMPEHDRLSTVVADHTRGAAEISAIAKFLARFHGTAERGPAIDRAGTVTALSGRWGAVLDGLCDRPDIAAPDRVARLETLARRYLAGRAPLFETRIAQRRIVDGHGDLLADDIFGPAADIRILDCLDFDDALRYVDCVDDAAFLAMDLEFGGRPDLAQVFLAEYLTAAADHPPQSLCEHYLGYRAAVRAKVDGIRAVQGVAAAADRARRHTDLALRHLERGAVRLVLVGGLPGTGKTTLARRLADQTGATVLSTDTVRRELQRAGQLDGAPETFAAGRYSTAAVTMVYATVRSRAETLLTHGESVILDASWTDPSERKRARTLAVDSHADLYEFHCISTPSVANRRLLERGATDSDATPRIAAAMAARVTPWPEAVELDTARPVAQTVASALQAAWPHLHEDPRPGLLVSFP